MNESINHEYDRPPPEFEIDATELPMSFHDTANSITHNAYAFKDVLTCVDDYHPPCHRESENMKTIMQLVYFSLGRRKIYLKNFERTR